MKMNNCIMPIANRKFYFSRCFFIWLTSHCSRTEPKNWSSKCFKSCWRHAILHRSHQPQSQALSFASIVVKGWDPVWLRLVTWSWSPGKGERAWEQGYSHIVICSYQDSVQIHTGKQRELNHVHDFDCVAPLIQTTTATTTGQSRCRTAQYDTMWYILVTQRFRV